ncbi:transcriptional regulator [Salmonella enterica]|uniref:PapB/FocB family fimbrial expression transcriptional regulator n=1 Tax=Enterobacteriaceae TaxID=543 RepID=UPI000693D58E|nr:PapB/FocB family fimbrial expression transcriptional regulator [Escherichia coli]EEP4893657.1 transcriptional regulator [Salmonella enterica]HCJ7760364.1 transcriptional regulator [Citrobacter freundii]EFC1147590.1 transcriptional regulator [Escherichia coli]ELJ6308782.1 transcriptional regulator [Salmonella enterica]MGW04227.1 transcriptional regulator [Salmonella enterica]
MYQKNTISDSPFMRSVPGYITDGKMDIRYFRLLSTICTVRNDQMHQALASVMVGGLTRREACERFGVSQSHFSIKYRQMQLVSQTVARMHAFILSEGLPD